MKSRLSVLPALLLLAGALLAPPASAELCSVDNGLGATLLLPYFEVDLDDPFGQTTLMTITNGRSDTQLVNVTIWTDLSVVVLNFNLYLTGFDVQAINLRDLFLGDGFGYDTGPTTSNLGSASFGHVQFPDCDLHLPGPPPLPASFKEHLRTSLTGRPSPVFQGLCAGVNRSDNVARGFVTVDVIDRCTFVSPGEAGYFGPDGAIGYDNALMGEFFYIDAAEGYAQGENLVRIQADPEAFGENDYTFYGRFVGYDGSDGREPLPALWAARFLNGQAPPVESELIIWRDPMLEGKLDPFVCGLRPPWFPLDHAVSDFYAFDEEENFEFPGACPICSPPFVGPVFTASAGRYGQGDFFLTFDGGWFRLPLGVYANNPLPIQPPTLEGQAHVMSVMRAEGRFSASVDATPLSDACRTVNPNFLPFLRR